MKRSSVIATALYIAMGSVPSQWALASQASEPAAFAAVKFALKGLSQRGKSAEGSSITFSPADMTYVGDAEGGIVYIAQVGTLGSLALKTRLPITGQAERPTKDLMEVGQKVRDACTSGNGTIELRQPPLGYEQASVPIVARATNALIAEKLIGQFWCSSSTGDPLFMVEVLPASGASSAPFSLGWDWYIAVELISPTVLEGLQQSRAKYRQAVMALRGSVKPGQQVQVAVRDLPNALRQPWSGLHHTDTGSMCGVVTDVKGTTALVQIGVDQVAVDTSRLLPQGIRKRLNEFRISDLRQPQYACAM